MIFKAAGAPEAKACSANKYDSYTVLQRSTLFSSIYVFVFCFYIFLSAFFQHYNERILVIINQVRLYHL